MIRRFTGILAISVLMLALGCTSPERHVVLDNFYGIPWGTQKYPAIKAMEKLGAVLDSVQSDSSMVMLHGGSAFGMPVKLWIIRFIDDRIWCGGFVLEPEWVREVVPTYLKVKDSLTSLYGIPDDEDKTIDLSLNYREAIKAIRDAPNALGVTWKFTQRNGKVPDAILLTVMKGADISVVFLDGTVAFSAVRRNRGRAD